MMCQFAFQPSMIRPSFFKARAFRDSSARRSKVFINEYLFSVIGFAGFKPEPDSKYFIADSFIRAVMARLMDLPFLSFLGPSL